ncbi:MAG: UDP-N-acetylmuramate dehydrogenase [Spirochaetia bacterium]
MRGIILFDEPLARHTTFEVGGPAEVFTVPQDIEELKKLLDIARKAGVPVTVLGTGANVLAADRGIEGITLHLGGFSGCAAEGNLLTAGAGLPVHDAAVRAADCGLSGLEFFYSMPGTVGGAVYMNARCYGSSAADLLKSVKVLSPDMSVVLKTISQEEFDYKVSPFQTSGELLLEAEFELIPGDPDEIRKRMRFYEKDRAAKGHFDMPSAGSVFKNNRSFGRPSGAIIDSLGLKGHRVGGAMISPKHANIIVNTGDATAADIRTLIEDVKDRVYSYYGYKLSEEVIYIGEWDEYDN